MAEDVLAVWMDGFDQPAGYLVRTAHGDTAFSYSPGYGDVQGLPLSLSMPLKRDAFGDFETRAFFANLLPENNQLRRIMEREGLARDDVVGLLRHMGADCAGSVSCLPADDPPVKTPGDLKQDYEALEDQALVRIARSLRDEQRLPVEVRDPSAVAGAQSKIALTRLPDGRFALPVTGSGVPTTHILKVPRKREYRDTRHEEASAILASAAGLDVSVPISLKIDDVDALLIERFDRQVIDGKVRRIHQEDFAQALGLPSDLKYQRNGTPERRFDVDGAVAVLDQTRFPEAARLAFLKTTLFNLCIGNTDNHAKNHAVLYDAPGPPRLAPLYDLLPIRLSRDYTHDLAFQLGAATRFDDLNQEDLIDFFVQMGVSRDDIDLLITQEVAPLIASLEGNADVLRSGGMKTFNDLMGREMEALVETLRLALNVEPRDYFPSEGS